MMQGRLNYRKLKLLATTSLLAGAVAAMPVSLDFHFDQPLVQSAQADSCCFAPGTKVLMADGSERVIEKIRSGDLVMGRGGRCNRVVTVEQPRLGARKLYALNGGPAFVTAEHPFLTMSGWRALDPLATAAENPDLAVKPLTRGDLLARVTPTQCLQVAGNTVLKLEYVLEFQALLSIEAMDADPEMPLYNLLLDGNHSYVAEGYLVHNKGGGDGGGGDGGGGDGGGGSGSDGGGSGSGSDGGDHDGGDRDGGDHDGGDRDGDSDNSGPGSDNSGSGSDNSGPSGDDGDDHDGHDDHDDHDDDDRDDDDDHDDDDRDDDDHDDDDRDDDDRDDDENDDKDNSPDDDGTPDQGSGDNGAGDQDNSPDDDGTPDQGSGDNGAGGQDNSPDDDGTPDQGSGDAPSSSST